MNRTNRFRPLIALLLGGMALAGCSDTDSDRTVEPMAPSATKAASRSADNEDVALRSYLTRLGFTGRIGQTVETRLDRHIDHQLADIGRNLWFDRIQGLNNDNTCAGCHSPTNGFGDTQSMAIGIDNNGIVGPGRSGPRNQRRTPMAINVAFYPTLMWNSRFRALSGDPFDNSKGFDFPAPEGRTLSNLPHLLTAQAFIPPTERTEAAGFHFPGGNDDIRNEVLRRLNASDNYRRLFARVFPHVKAGGPITFDDFARAISEFEFTQVYTDAPIDRYARGRLDALTSSEKRGANLFFGRAGCVSCHAVSGGSNEMFSDFKEHVVGIPQIVPANGNVTFDGPDANEDFGLEQVTGNSADRYGFRTSPLRNVALQPAFMHNGAFVRLEDAIRYHLDALTNAPTFSTDKLAPDLRTHTGPAEPVLERLDTRLQKPVKLTKDEFDALVEFVRDGLLDPAARSQQLRLLIPETLPSGRPNLIFR
jgi:cytochrome c peroxidase